MKIRSLTITLAILGLATSVIASDKVQEKQDAKSRNAKHVQEGEKEKVLLTGSYIKQDVRRNGRMTDSHSHVVVLDRATIEKSGAGDLKQVLIRTGVR